MKECHWGSDEAHQHILVENSGSCLTHPLQVQRVYKGENDLTKRYCSVDIHVPILTVDRSTILCFAC